MTITLRATKGSRLTHEEMDANFTFTQSGAEAVATDLLTKARERVTFEDFGATGDGVADDTAEIQAALNSGAKLVEGTKGKTYLVSNAGTKSILGTAHNYCLLIPDGVTIDLKGATVKLAATQNSSIFLNSTAGTTQNSDVGLGNGVLDGNETNQTTAVAGDQACVMLWDVLRPKVWGLRAKNARSYFGRFLKIDNGYFNNLNGKRSDGDGWSFGLSASAQAVVNSFIDNIYAEDCTNNTHTPPTGAGAQQGNGFISVTNGCVIGKVEAVNCGGAIKLQDTTTDTTVGQLSFIGGANGTTNSGIKLQGGAGLQNCKRVVVGSIFSQDAEGEGLLVEDASEIEIGAVLSYRDGDTGGTSAIVLDDTAANIQIGRIHVEEGGAGGVEVQADNVQIGTCFTKNNGQVTASTANFQVAAAADGVKIGSLISVDNQGSPTASRGLNLVSGSKNITVGSYHSKGNYTVSGLHIADNGATNFRMGVFMVDDTVHYSRQTSVTAVGNVGTGEDDLISLTIPLRSLYSNGTGYRITAWGTTANNSNTKELKLKFGSATILTTALTVSEAGFWKANAVVTRTAANAQTYTSTLVASPAVLVDTENGTATQTDSSAIIVKCTGTVVDGGGGVNNDDIVQSGLILEPI